MMKRLFPALIIAIAATLSCQANGSIESIITCPGENSATQMNISWAAADKGTCVVYTTTTDKNWKNAQVAQPDLEQLCTTYDSIYSKRAWNENYYEHNVFFKCGATLRGLTPDTNYKYRIEYRTDGRTLEKSPEHNFRTAGAKQWSCCIISDFHSYTPLPHRLADAMDMMATIERYDPSIDFVLHLGDVCAWGGSWSFWRALYAHENFSKYMWAGLNGNHDNMSRKYELTSAYFRDANYVPRNGYAGQEGVCYHFRYGNAMFVMLNNEEMHDSTNFEAAAAWLRDVVTKARHSANPPRYVIVCEHYQWFYGNNGKTSQYGRWHKIFDELGIDLALAGNNHVYARSACLYDDQVTDGSKGTVYMQTASSDNERGRKLEEQVANFDKIMFRWAEGANMICAVNMKADDKALTLALLDRYGNTLDTFTVKAKQ
ncbi:MAG: metallophosphoesterase family protein [Bacteroidales bacterium]|nr:metallophosphoesterase family protein [Candidatus Sodaliphilus aphodohippi]